MTDYAMAGQSAQRASWDFALACEAVEATKGHTVSWLGDLEKCYELIPFRFILEEAREVGFPAVLAEMAIAMYAGRRRVIFNKVYSRAVKTNKGIVAGCSIATTLIKVCLFRILRRVWTLYPSITPRIYLDDISLQWKGRSLRYTKVGGKRWAAPPRVFINSVAYCIELLGEVMEARVSAKSRVLANSMGLLKSCENAFKKKGLVGKGTGAVVARVLGVDCSSITHVSGNGPTRKARQVKVRKVKPRVQALRKAGAPVSGVWLAGPAKSLEFGAEVYGVNDSLLGATRRMAGSVLLPGGGGRSLTKGFLVAGKQFMDPICQEGIAPH